MFAKIIRILTQLFSNSSAAKTTQLEGNSLKLKDITVEQFSNDSNLTNNEQSVPTEKAVKNYVDGAITDIKATLTNKADSTEVKSEINALSTELKADLNQEISDIKATLANKAARNGDSQMDFNAKSLNVETSIYSKTVATETINSQTVASVKAVSNGFYQVSSRALKEEIIDLSSQEVAAILKTLNPVKFIYTEDESKTLHVGFIAEDTLDLLTANDKQAIKILDLVAVLTKVMQDHEKTLRELVNVVQKQEIEINRLKQTVQ
jgi:Chaperone of endosialidase